MSEQRGSGDQEEGDDSDPGTDQQEHRAPLLCSGEDVEEAPLLCSGEDVEEATSLADGQQHRELPRTTGSVGNSIATVKIILVPEGHVMTMAFAIGLCILDLKHHFASELKVPAEVLQISLDGSVVEEQRTLMELGVQPHGTTQLEMSSTDPVHHPVRPVRPPQHYNMPDVITVRVPTDPDRGVYQEVVVEIERPPQRKAFLGGYRHRPTGTEYHHASVQTPPKRRPDRGVTVFSRDTQTVSVRDQAQQCPNSTSTQMTCIGCYVSCTEDKLVAPGNYLTAHHYHSRRLRAVVTQSYMSNPTHTQVITLQRHARGWRARRRTEQLRRDRDLRLAWMEMEDTRKREEKEEKEHSRRADPRSKEDLAQLYSALERWRCEETERIDATLRGAERKAALCSLLDEETRLISYIGRHRIAARHGDYDKAVTTFLDKCAAPRRWRACDGKMTQMDTQDTIRARELRDLYNNIIQASFTQENRLDVLLTLKHTVKEHDCQLTRDIVELIDREADLMMRRVKGTKLEGLRKRISTLFLQYIKTPTFNPEVAKVLKVPPNPTQPRKKYFCCGCCRYLRSTDFCLTANARVVGRCRRCSQLENQARSREDLSLYKTILSKLQAGELQRNKEANITYLLQEKDLRYLVDVVWGAQSALSACSDLRDLVLVRWERLEEWSPWNCILLSRDEAPGHLQEDSVHEAYGMAFIRNVHLKHTLAKKYFAQIPAMAQYLHSVESQHTALGTQPVSKTITTATGHVTPASSAQGEGV
ncbi:IQ motif and ubiquitin-like domain-containing protein [Polymixia lowei]